MKINMHLADRAARIAAALVVVVLVATGILTGIAAIVLSILAVVFFVTSLVGFCPLYALLKIPSRPRNER
jgi:hypothetical protein